MTLLSAPQTAYIVIGIFGILLVITLIVFLFIRIFYIPKHIKELTYLKLYRFCEANDYLLLNNLKINIDDHNVGLIDHIVISKKFIVIINDFPISGVLKGNFIDENLTNYNKGKPFYVVNPLNYNINLTKRLALFNDLNQGLLKGLVVINNDSYIDINGLTNQFKVIKLKELKKTIKSFDKENLKPLKEDSVVRFINSLNDRNNEHGN